MSKSLLAATGVCKTFKKIVQQVNNENEENCEYIKTFHLENIIWRVSSLSEVRN